MANEDYFSQDLSDYNPYYAPYYDDQNKKSKDKNSKKSKKEQKNSDGKNLLRRAEDSSLSSKSSQNPWQNNVQGKSPVTPGPKGIKLTGKGKGKGFVLGIIIALIFGGGAFLSSTNILLPGAISALFTGSTNSAYAGYILRSVTLQGYALTTGDATSGVGILKRYKSMSNSFVKRLAANNIQVSGTGSNKVLRWTQVDASGNAIRTIDIDAREFKTYYMNNAEFRNDYSNAKRSRIVTFFDPNANTSYSKKGYSRNEWKDYEQTGNSKTDVENYETKMKSQFDNNTASSSTRGEKSTLNEDGESVKEMGNEDLTTRTKSDSDSMVTAEMSTRSYITEFANKAAVGLNGACALIRVGNAVSLMMSALEKADASRYFLNGAENVSKMMAGEGQNSAINEFLNDFTTPVNTTVYQFNKGINDVSGIDLSGSGYPTASSDAATTIPTEEKSGAPIQAQGVQKILGGNKNITNDILNYSSERISSTISKALGMDRGAFMSCLGVQAGAAVISIAVTIASFGTSAIIDIAWDVFKNVGIGFAAQAILNFAIPTLAKYLYSNIFETVKGVEAGELFAYGAAVTNFGTGQYASGQIPASKEAVLQYNKSVQQVAALDAEVDRLNLSPLDITSPNTFLGSIAYSLLPIITSEASTSVIGTLLKTTAKSINKVTGLAYADDNEDSYMTTFGNDIGACPQLDSMGYACDIYGNAIPISTFIDIEPDDERYLEVIGESVTCIDDICEINDNSELAKFIMSNVNRESPIGAIDTNILGAFEEGNVIVSSIPVIGDLVDLYNVERDLENYSWADGSYIGYTPNNPNAEKVAYFQRYIEDQRILDEVSEDNNNPVTAFINKYEAEHPVDDSFTGYLARITGLPKETTETVIAMVDYYLFLEDYDPSTRIAMTEENTTIQPASTIIAKFDNSKLNFSNNSETNEEIFLAKQSEQYIIYADIRNRSYVA